MTKIFRSFSYFFLFLKLQVTVVLVLFYFLQNLRGWSKYLVGSIKTLINTTLVYWKHFMLTWTIRLRTTTVHFFITVNDSWDNTNLVIFWHMDISCHAQLHFTVELQIYIDISLLYIWLTSLKEIQTQFLSPRLFVHVPQYS